MSNSNRSYLIIGLGFIGINILRSLWLEKAKVTVFSKKINPKVKKAVGNDVELIEGDLRDEAKINEVVKGKDVIFALAGRSGQVASLEEPFLDLEVNLNGQLILLEAVKKLNPEARVLFPGSRLEYGRLIYIPVDEDHPLNPLSLYGIHKLTAEKYYLEYNRIFGLRTTVLRITNPYGPHLEQSSANYNIVNFFIDQARSGKDLSIYGKGDQIRDYIYIDDLTRVMLEVTKSNQTIGEVYNVGTGRGVSFKNMAETTAKQFKVGIDYLPWPNQAKQVETGDFIANIDKLKQVLPQHSFHSIQEGLEISYQVWVNKNDIFWSKII